MSNNLKWRAQSTIYRDSIDLLAVVDYGNGDRAAAKRVEFTLERLEPHMPVNEPTLELSPQSARSLMQALWDAGIRPNDGDGSGEHVAALKRHIVFAEKIATALLPTNG